MNRYSVLQYFAYLLYAPLYLAGPITSFNAWQAQIEAPWPVSQAKMQTLRTLGIYGLRWGVNLLVMLVFLHLDYASAVLSNWRNNVEVFQTMSVLQFVILGLSVCIFIWLKLLLIWRFHRLCRHPQPLLGYLSGTLAA